MRGDIHRRQETDRLTKPRATLFTGKKKEEFRAMFRKYAFKFADQEMGVAKILLKAVIGDEAINRVMKCGVEAYVSIPSSYSRLMIRASSRSGTPFGVVRQQLSASSPFPISRWLVKSSLVSF